MGCYGGDFFQVKKIIILLFLISLFLFSCRKKETYPDFIVDFLDVGKADCMVLRTENSTVVIDCGEKGDGKQILSLLAENEIETVDYLIITHYDKDHVGGATKLINNIEVKNILAPDYAEDSNEVKKYNKALAEKNITPMLMHDNISFTFDDVEYIVYAPKKTFYGEDDDNDFSLVTKVVYHDTTMLFTGDAMEQRLEEIMDIGNCTLLKIPYHARKIDNLETFINRVKPEYAVACTSAEEFSDSTKDILNKFRIKCYSTCENGRITAVNNGNDIIFSTQY